MSEVVKVELELPRDIVGALDISVWELKRYAKELIALELFKEGRISAGKAAELLEIPKADFIELLSRRGITYLDQPPEELKAEVEAIEQLIERCAK
jgi:predicted HTH domain antitoxin